MFILKHFKTLQHVSIIFQIIFREFVCCIFSSGYFPGVKLNLTPGKYPEENIQYSNHGESLKPSLYVPC